MGLGFRHVVAFAATMAIGSFIYVLTLEPMDATEHPRAAAMDRAPSRMALIGNIRRTMARGQMINADGLADKLVQHYPEDLAAVFYRAIVDRELGREDAEAARWAQLSRELAGLESWTRRYSQHQLAYFRAWTLIATGETGEGRAAFTELAEGLEERSLADDGEITSPNAHFFLACYRALAGDRERGLHHWGRAVELGYGQGMANDGGWWMVDPHLAPLRDDERFWAIGATLADETGGVGDPNWGVEAREGESPQGMDDDSDQGDGG